MTVARIWGSRGLQPHRVRNFFIRFQSGSDT